MESHRGNYRQWHGIWTESSSSPEPQYCGPLSSTYFFARLRTHVTSSLKIPKDDFLMQPRGANTFLASPTSSQTDPSEDYSIPFDGFATFETIPRQQEENFLALFWQGYHCTIPILNEVEFKEHYESLWGAATPSVRKPSPLVDIILALCMQYGMTFIPRNESLPISTIEFDNDDPTLAGRALYHRCQMLLSTKIEAPTILTLQCHILSTAYLWKASFVNTANNSLALAIRTAHTLGIHLEPPKELPQAQKELHRRLWWMTYAMETTSSMTLGRPLLVNLSFVSCALPTDEQEVAAFSGPSFVSPCKEITWLSYHVQRVKLILAAGTVLTAFEEKCGLVLSNSDQENFHKDPQSLESLAGFLLQNLQCLRSWVQDVPDALKTQRDEGGKPFSTDRSALRIELEAPQWLQRQRLLLEIRYHSIMMDLYRPFINFAKPPSSATPLTDSNSISCLNHAIASTNIIVQILRGTDIMTGWYEIYEFQWKSTLTILGFIFGNPVCPPTPTARKTLDKAISVFDIFRNNFAVAASAANVTRDMAVKVDSFLEGFRPASTSTQQSPAMTRLANTSLVPRFNKNQSTDMQLLPQVDVEGDSVMSQNILPSAVGMDFLNDPLGGFDWSSSEISGLYPEWPPVASGS